MNATELEAILAEVRDAAREAAALVSRGYRRRLVVEHKGAVDLVTEYDRASEDLLRARLSKLGIDVVGEEHGGTQREGAAAFYVDPLDGTTNFVHGHPFWCVSIGLVVGPDPVLGVVLAPALGLEWYGYVASEGGRGGREGGRDAKRRAWGSALAGEGTSELEACAVSRTETFEDALLATGFPYDRRTSAENNFDAFVAIKKRCQAVRRCGSAALDLCLVADGTYEGYWERKLKPWDIAAGIAIVRGAGGRVTDFDSGPSFMKTCHVVASNGLIHEALLDELAKVHSARSGQP